MTSGFSPAETPPQSFPLSSDWSPLFSLVDQVAERQRQDFGRLASDLKADGSLITECDRWSDATLAAGLAEIFPRDGLLSEEGSTSVPEAPGFWVVDPLDGTTNFSVGLPIWAISMARIEDGRPVAALLDVPPLGQRLLALRGQGVWSNGQPLAPPARSLLVSDGVAGRDPASTSPAPPAAGATASATQAGTSTPTAASATAPATTAGTATPTAAASAPATRARAAAPAAAAPQEGANAQDRAAQAALRVLWSQCGQSVSSAELLARWDFSHLAERLPASLPVICVTRGPGAG